MNAVITIANQAIAMSIGSTVSVQCGNKMDTGYRGIKSMIILDTRENGMVGKQYLVWDTNGNGLVAIAEEMQPVRNRDLEEFGQTDLENVPLYTCNGRGIGTNSSPLTGVLNVSSASKSLGW